MAGRKETSGAASLSGSTTGCRLQACQSLTLSSPGAQARHWAMLKLITDIHPALTGLLDAGSGREPRLTQRGVCRRVARIIPVPGTCSNCWLHFAQQDAATVSQTLSDWYLFTLSRLRLSAPASNLRDVQGFSSRRRQLTV